MSVHSGHIWSSMNGHQAACSCKWVGEEYNTRAEAEVQRDRHIAAEQTTAHRDTPMQPLVYVPPVAHALTRLELEVCLLALEVFGERKLSADKSALASHAAAKIAAMIELAK